MASIALAVAGLASAVGGVASSAIGANAAQSAAGEQVQQQEQALQFQQQMWNQQQANQAPFVSAGQQSITQIMKDLQSGKYGPGSLPAVPTAPGAFQAPTLAQAEQTPGYQFTEQQGTAGILKGAAGAGGAISGGTLKALDQYNQGLATTTYGNVFNQALQGYNANLSQYGAQLSQYQTAQGAQQQAFQQELAPAEVGEGAIANLNQSGSQVAQNIGQIYGNIGNSQAAGTVGAANAVTSGITGATNSISQIALLNSLLNGGGLANTPSVNPQELTNLGVFNPISYGVGPS